MRDASIFNMTPRRYNFKSSWIWSHSLDFMKRIKVRPTALTSNFDLDFQSQASCGHDPLHTSSSLKFSLFKKMECKNDRTDGADWQTDGRYRLNYFPGKRGW